jgi:hypothetical protein
MKAEANAKIGKLHPGDNESGQSILFIALLTVGLFAVIGLAIDGGRIFIARRNTQIAADAAGVAAAHALCAGEDPVEAGRWAAAQNGLTHNGDSVIVTVASPPLRVVENQDGTPIEADLRHYVDVYVTQTIDPYFIQVIYDGELKVTSDRLSSCTPPFDPISVPAVWAGATTCDRCEGTTAGTATLTWTGADNVFTSPGGLFYSGGDIVGDGDSTHPSSLTGSIAAVCDVGFSGVIMTGGGSPEVGVSPLTDPPLPFTIDDFVPGGSFANRAQGDPDAGLYFAITPTVADTGYWDPDPVPVPYRWYNDGVFAPEGPLEGLYYIEGEVWLNNAVFEDANGDGDWDGVTIVATGRITADEVADPLKYYIGGILVMSDYRPSDILDCSSDQIGIDVRGHTLFEGIIFAPWSGVSFSGSDTAVIGAIIGQFVEISGSSMYFEYRPDLLDPIAPSVRTE